MTGPVILITGSTDGIGRASAAALLQEGAEVIIHGKDRRKVETVRQVLGRESGGSLPEAVTADLSEMGQVRTMAADLSSRYSRLDVLLNNAGTYQKVRRLNTEGFEVTFAVNYLAPFLLTNLLISLLRKSPSARIVTVASSAHEDVGRIDWDNLPGLPRYDAWGAYALSKFADVTFTYVLARQLKPEGITANCLHPGVTATKLLHSAFPKMTGITPEEAAKTPVCLATSAHVAGVSGKYFEELRPVQSSAMSRDRKVQERLWTLAENLTGLSPPEKSPRSSSGRRKD